MTQLTKVKKPTSTLPKEIFELKDNPALLHQVLTGYLANKRIHTASTKTRGEVAGSGIKPWRQKGTGRARHGSRRSPIWVGGGITFGPRSNRNYKKTLPKRLRLSALAHSLSNRNKDSKIIITPKLDITDYKTKSVIEFVKKLNIKGSVVLVTAKTNQKLARAAKNVPWLSVAIAGNLTAYDVIKNEFIVFDQSAVTAILDRYAKAQR